MLKNTCPETSEGFLPIYFNIDIAQKQAITVEIPRKNVINLEREIEIPIF